MNLIIKKCASPHITFWVLIYMMLLLIFGTIAQKYIGLYGALDKYFYSWILWAGYMPLPGGLSVMSVFFLNLLARFLGYSVWTREKAGIHLAHAGVILLLIGGIISGISRTDTVLPMIKDELRGYTQSYDDAALTVYKNGLRIKQFNLNKVSDNQNLSHAELPFNLQVLNKCINCKITFDKKSGGMNLVDIPSEKDREQNLSGLTFKIDLSDSEETQKYLSFLFFPKPPTIKIDGDEYIFTTERVYSLLPFDIKLESFNIEYYPGTSTAKSYQSDVQIFDDGHSVPASITMNEPLTYKNYRFYQSAYETNNRGEYVSILAVVYNKGRIFPYLAGLITALGLALHILNILKGRLSQSAVKFGCLLILMISASSPALASDIKIGTDFKTLPVLHEGRIKPIDSFARLQLKKLSGSEAPFAEAPSATLARLIFNPYDAVRLNVFEIKNKSVLSAFGIAKRKDNLYSYSQLVNGLEKTRKEFIDILQDQNLKPDAYQSALTDIHNKALYFLQLVRSFSFAMPLEGSDSDAILDYRELQKNTILLRNALEAIRDEKGDDIDAYSAREKETAYMNYQLDTLEQTGKNNLLLRVIPSSDPREKFTTPWQVLTGGKGRPDSGEYIQNWIRLMVAYQAQNQHIWNRAVIDLKTNYDDQKTSPVLKAEYFYNLFNPVLISIILVFAGAITATFLTVQKINSGHKALFFTSVLPSLILGATILFRTFVLGRPPVGTLYESILFVSFILCMAGSLWAFIRQRINILPPVFILSGFLLLLAKSIDGDQDNMQVMEAVLNTNFWLSTHVLIITAGYAWCLLTSVIAHLELYKPNKKNKKTTLHLHAIVSLFLISLGTILGGIWADMSWGRFWGWDPKENGALLIALWLIWALHSRASKHLSQRGFETALAFLSVIIMLSWFGVNLLNVGLHSYGFVSGLAAALFAFIIFEMTLIGGLVWRLKK